MLNPKLIFKKYNNHRNLFNPNFNNKKKFPKIN